MKRITILLLIVLFLGGCKSTEKKETDYLQNNTIVYLSEKENHLYLSSYDEKTKRDTKKVQIGNNKLKYNSKYIIDYSLFTLQDGYAVYYEYGNVGNKNKNGDGTLLMSDPQGIDKRLAFYDKKLHYNNELNLTQLFKDTVLPEGQVAIDKTGTKLAATGTKYGFGIYDIKNKKWIDVGQPLKENQYCLDVAFTKDGQLNCLVNEEGMNYSFGLFDISKKSIILKKIEYIPQPVQNPDGALHHTDDLLYLDEMQMPQATCTAPSGKVIVMDIKTKQIKMLQVKGLESTYSRISPNGSFMITIVPAVDKNGHYNCIHINVYDTKTMKSTYENSISTDFSFDDVFVNNKGFLITLSKKDDSKVIYYGFR